jgi:hypothetical protein
MRSRRATDLPLAFACVCVTAVGIHAAQTAPIFAVVENSQGQPVAFFQVRETPFDEGQPVTTRLFIGEASAIRDAEGRVVSGAALYAWTAGDRIEVAVMSLVPALGFPNRYLARPGDDMRRALRPVERGRFSMTVGSRREIPGLAELGFDTHTIAVTSERPAGMPRAAP